MANTNLFVLFLLLRSALPLSVSQVKKFVQSTDNEAVELTDRTIVFDLDTILKRVKDVEQVKSLNSVTVDAGVKKSKRDTIKGNHSCAQGMKWILNKCVTLEKYNASKDDDYEITALPEDEGTTLRSRPTTPPGTTSQPRPTPHSLTTPHPTRKPTPLPQTTSRLDLTAHSITTPRTELTPQTLRKTPRPEPTPHSLTNKSSKQEHFSSSLMYLVAVILVQYQTWCYYHTTF